jgi:hypothetical protein
MKKFIPYGVLHVVIFGSVYTVVLAYELLLIVSDGHTFVYSLHRYRYRYIVSNDRYKRTPSVICL